MREPFLNETDAPPRRRSLTLATQQKSFLYIFYFAPARLQTVRKLQILPFVILNEMKNPNVYAGSRS